MVNILILCHGPPDFARHTVEVMIFRETRKKYRIAGTLRGYPVFEYVGTELSISNPVFDSSLREILNSAG